MSEVPLYQVLCVRGDGGGGAGGGAPDRAPPRRRQPSWYSTVTQVNRGSTFALRRSTLEFYLGG